MKVCIRSRLFSQFAGRHFIFGRHFVILIFIHIHSISYVGVLYIYIDREIGPGLSKGNELVVVNHELDHFIDVTLMALRAEPVLEWETSK